MRAAWLVIILAVLVGCDRGGPEHPAPLVPHGGMLPPYTGGFRLPVDGRWRVQRTHYGNPNDQSSGLDLVLDAPLPPHGSPLSDYPSYGQPIVADAPGMVVIAVDGHPDNPQGVIDTYDAHGNYVVIDHGDGTFSLFAHLIPGSLRVRAGQVVAMGQPLGLVGNSGRTTMPHLHWQVMNGPLAHQAQGLPVRYLPYERNGKLTTERPDKRDRVQAVP
jgi:murein DD-endopeptidase MepM/ murein hydrolase activator NlpD